MHSAAQLRDPNTWPSVQASMQHLQRCLMALQKIVSIDEGRTAVSSIASKAIENKEFP